MIRGKSEMKEGLLNLGTILVVLFTVTFVVVLGIRQLSSGLGKPVPTRQPPTLLEDWEAIGAAGHRLGPESADVRITVFSDFECPACQVFATRTYPEFRDRHPGRTALFFRHWPLSSHEFAYHSARAPGGAGAALGALGLIRGAHFCTRDRTLASPSPSSTLLPPPQHRREAQPFIASKDHHHYLVSWLLSLERVGISVEVGDLLPGELHDHVSSL